MAFTPTLRRAAAQTSASTFAPKYYVPFHFKGLTLNTAYKIAPLVGSLGVAAGVGLIFFLGEVPRVRKDILQRVPFLDQYFDRTVAPEDNPF